MKHIVVTCKGNIGRSPVAELVGHQYLQSVGADKEYVLSSSGTMTDAVLKGLRTPAEMETSMTIFTASGLHHSSFDLYRQALQKGRTEETQKYAIEAMAHCVESEMNKRDSILRELRVEGTPKRRPEQMVPRDDVDYILAVDRKVYDDVTKSPGGIYYGRQRMPVINVLSVFATGNPEERDAEVDLRDPQSVWNSYRKSIERIIEHTPLALQKIISA